MRISRIYIRNFRNFRQLDLPIGEHAVIVGENRVGKSNLLFAMRLILDPSLPDTGRRLRLEDFWDGLARPLSKDDSIEVSIDLADFQDDDNCASLLVDYLIETEPMVARLTYEFRPTTKSDEEPPAKEADYEFLLYGGGRPENALNHEVRRRLPLDLLPALRDAEGDLANWRRSPLRPLLDNAAAEIDQNELMDLAKGISEATDQVAAVPAIGALAGSINASLIGMVSEHHASELSFGFSPVDADRLVRSLRLLIDGGKRGIPESSLGAANLLYLVLTNMQIVQHEQAGERNHTFLAIEEPEAHLHPHLQRCVFRSFLRPRHLPGDAPPRSYDATVLLSTHSPHVVSIAPVRSLVLLRRSKDDGASVGVSTANLALSPEETDDIERYLDVTRGEIVFAKGVVLVEGEAEEYLVPVLAKRLGYDLDKLGISVCSVGGTHFTSYVKFLGKTGLNIPFAVVTDEDPTAKRGRLGVSRIRKLMEHLQPDIDGDDDELVESAKAHGLFLTDQTLEVALWNCGRRKSLKNAFLRLATSNAAKKRAENDWKDKDGKTDFRALLADIEDIGKGRLAQRWAARIGRTSSAECPDSIREAIEYVVNQV